MDYRALYSRGTLFIQHDRLILCADGIYTVPHTTTTDMYLYLTHAHIEAAYFAHSPLSSSSSLPTLSVPLPNLPHGSELQSPIQEDRVHQAFRFPTVSSGRPVLGAREDALQ